MPELPAIEELMSVRAAGCVTLCVPLRPGDADRDRVRLEIRHAVETARAGLIALGVDARDRETMLAPVEALCVDRPAVPRDGTTLLAFLTPTTQQVHRVGWALPKRVEVADRLYLADLLAAIESSPPCYALALSDDAARLLRCVGPRVTEVALPLARANRAEANAERVSPTPGGNLHANTSGAGVTGSPTMHKQGFGHEDRDANERDTWYAVVCDALDACAGIDDGPVVLIADVVHHTPFRARCRHPSLHGEGVQLNPAGATDAGLAAQARAALGDAYAPNPPSGEIPQLHDLPAIIDAAQQGRVDTFYFVPGQFEPGRLTEAGVEPHSTWRPGDVDLVDLALRETIKTGGDVVPVEPGMLSDQAVCATLRWTTGG